MLGFSLRNKVPNEKIRRRTQLTDVMVLWRRGVHSGVNKNKIDKKKKKINFKQPGRLLMSEGKSFGKSDLKKEITLLLLSHRQRLFEFKIGLFLSSTLIN